MESGKGRYTFEDLIRVMETLRSKCPWDREQTHQSLKRYLIEEAYEVLEAIDSGDDSRLMEELGDILLQPVFHAQIAKERSAFDINDVVDALVRKLIERHPHVFGDAEPEDVLRNWERKKMENRESVLEGVPRHLPALMRSQKLQEKSAQVGFCFRSVSEILGKVEEELEELKGAIQKGDKGEMEHEIGDLLTAVAELARNLGIDAEEALQKANDRFTARFRRVEELAKRQGRELKDMDLEELNALWETAKSELEDQ